MATVKTAISIQKSLFDRVDELADELQVPRSRIVAIAVEEFIERYESRKLLELLNEVYADGPDRDEEALLQAMRRHQRQLLEKEW